MVKSACPTEIYLPETELIFFLFFEENVYSRTSLGSWKFVRDMGNSEPLMVNHSTRSGSK